MRIPLFMLMLLCGCAALQPPMPPVPLQALGAATRATLAMQVLDPDASRSRQPVTGMDGRSATAAQARYQKSFSEAPQESVSIVSKK